MYLRAAYTILSLIKKMTVYYYTELRTRELLVIDRRHDGGLEGGVLVGDEERDDTKGESWWGGGVEDFRV